MWEGLDHDRDHIHTYNQRYILYSVSDADAGRGRPASEIDIYI